MIGQVQVGESKVGDRTERHVQAPSTWPDSCCSRQGKGKQSAGSVETRLLQSDAWGRGESTDVVFSEASR